MRRSLRDIATIYIRGLSGVHHENTVSLKSQIDYGNKIMCISHPSIQPIIQRERVNQHRLIEVVHDAHLIVIDQTVSVCVSVQII